MHNRVSSKLDEELSVSELRNAALCGDKETIKVLLAAGVGLSFHGPRLCRDERERMIKHTQSLISQHIQNFFIDSTTTFDETITRLIRFINGMNINQVDYFESSYFHSLRKVVRSSLVLALKGKVASAQANNEELDNIKQGLIKVKNEVQLLSGSSEKTSMKEIKTLIRRIDEGDQTPAEIEAIKEMKLNECRLLIDPAMNGGYSESFEDLATRLDAFNQCTETFTGDENKSYRKKIRAMLCEAVQIKVETLIECIEDEAVLKKESDYLKSIFEKLTIIKGLHFGIRHVKTSYSEISQYNRQLNDQWQTVRDYNAIKTTDQAIQFISKYYVKDQRYIQLALTRFLLEANDQARNETRKAMLDLFRGERELLKNKLLDVIASVTKKYKAEMTEHDSALFELLLPCQFDKLNNPLVLILRTSTNRCCTDSDTGSWYKFLNLLKTSHCKKEASANTSIYTRMFSAWTKTTVPPQSDNDGLVNHSFRNFEKL